MSKQNELSLDKEKDEAFLEALFETILENKNLEDIKMLINVLPDVNVASKNGTTFLMWASKEGMSEIVEELIKKGANVNIKNKNGEDATLLAYENGHLHLAHTLLEDKIKPVFTPNNNTNIKPNLFKQLFPQSEQQPTPSLSINFDRKDIYPFSSHSKWQERDKKVKESKKKHSIIDEINIDTPENILANALLIIACKKGHKGLIKQLLMRDDIDVNTFYEKDFLCQTYV
jgi:ankyrin repeat protein